ncbi:hypothetical protein J5U23_01457 [Saccharolobus shibatae B12]|uniref:Endonuclease GajA/Old nuclease/RecF-like AAA domain-containing protein n=1 Tax=Saccharolobus shibatae (strain ATCC 51178 / DSM 5389 / JCM 8931 / NBRC 15437 / B12) TaxID=523848 RepID=A0A8F5GT52_SACSH|nr:AAA family ATPase [Saccharolobus shibatae]QXJ28588.1 hypothetical protein J5U23_01457 [Saccharolobus shibatae B12]
MRLKITSLGPITERSEIELGDLTVFFGPPNSGKSTALKAIYYSLHPLLSNEMKDTFVNLGSLKLEYVTKDNIYEFKFHPSTDYLKDLLPEGEFSADPLFVKFVEENSLFENFKDTLVNTSIMLPSECKGVREVPYEAEISGKTGKVILHLTNELTPKCKEALYTELGKIIMPTLGKRIINKYMEKFLEYLRKEEKVSDVVLIPYSRSFVTFEALTFAELTAGKTSSTASSLLDIIQSIASAFILGLKFYSLENILGDIKELEIYFDKIKGRSEISGRIYKLLKPLIPGDIKILNDKLTYIEGDKPISWKYTSASIMEVVSLLLSVGEGQLILYEEPETQLHERLQVLMALILYAMSSFNKFAITTHSQTILYTLSFIAYLKPTAEEVKKLLDKLGVKNDELAKAIEEANNKKVKFYYFHDGKVEEKSAEEVSKGIPGITDVMDIELSWLSELYLSRGGKDASS